MKKIIAVMLIMAMLICGCGKVETATEPTDAASSLIESAEATAPTSEVTEPSIEESTDPVTDPEPDPYADIKANPLSLLDMTLGEFEATYGELEIKEYCRVWATDETYSRVLDMYFETDGGLFRSQGIREDHLIRGIFVNSLDSLSVKSGMSSDEIDLSGWDLYVGTPIVISGEEWYEPPIDGSGAVCHHTDDFRYGHTLVAFKELDGYWYDIFFFMPEEYEEYDYSTEDSFRWRDAFAEEVRAKKRSLTVARIEVRKEGTITR